MINNDFVYLFRNVSEEDYAVMKARESSIINSVRSKLRCAEDARDEEIRYFEKNKPTFRYNSGRQAVGIFLKEGRSKRLILSREDLEVMSDIERKIFFATRSVLDESLRGIRLKEEDWK